ncbi:MAG: LysR family transcriptional regulator [Planctomycetes bacterium]|nr:LysR family transcriptional regulator [Planctomycetota bacterium]
MIQLTRLEGFYWVARTGGYARAARAFPYGITQPAVHQQVKKLESELGTALLERLGKDRMELTPAGAHLFRFVAPFFEGLPGVIRSLTSGTFSGRLCIHAEPLLLRQLLPAWLKRIQRKRPDAHIELRELLEVDLETLRSGATDLLIAHLADEHGADDIATQRIASLHPFLVLPRDHRLAGRSRVTLADLAGEPFVAYLEGSIPHELQLRALHLHGVQPARTITTSSTESILGFVESGLGFSLVPSLSQTGPRGRGLVARPITAPRIEFPVVAAWRKDAPENPLLDLALGCAPR